MSARRIVILGGKGTGAIVAEAIRACAASGERSELLGFLNDAAAPGTILCGLPVLGTFEEWRLCPPDAVFISAIPKVKEAWLRYHRIKSLAIPQDRWTTVVHPAAHAAERVVLGRGTYVGPAATIEPGAEIGAHACLRGGSYVSHDVRVGDYVFIGPNATVLGNCVIEEGAHIGPNAVCREQLLIARYSVIGAGAAVVKNVPAFDIVAGNPAEKIRSLKANHAS